MKTELIIHPSFEIQIESRDDVYRVPTHIYQKMFDMAGPGMQQKVLEYLQDYVRDQYPGMELNSFIDLSNKDVQKLKSMGISGFTWGMYIQLRKEDGTLFLPVFDTVIKLLEL